MKNLEIRITTQITSETNHEQLRADIVSQVKEYLSRLPDSFLEDDDSVRPIEININLS